MSTKIGTFMKLKLDNKFMVGEMSSSITTAITLIDVSSKKDCRLSVAEAGRMLETGTVSSIATSNAAEAAMNWDSARTIAKAGTPVQVEITQVDCTTGSAVAGAINIRGDVLISNLTLDMPDQEKMTFSCDFQFVTDLTIATNPVA